MSVPEIVSYHCDSGLGIIHMADGQGNRLNGEFLSALNGALEKGLSDTEARILMIRSGEVSFCLGMDLSKLQDSLISDAGAGDTSDNTGEREAAVGGYSAVLQKLLCCHKPVIALVEGEVKAGGVGLAAACDIVLASSDAGFELSEILFGLVPFNVLPLVYGRRITPGRFRYMVLSAARIDAEKAGAWGLADEVFEAGAGEKAVKRLMKTMMRGEPGAFAAAKRFFIDADDMASGPLLEAAQRELGTRMQSPEVFDGIRAFQAGETPGWFGRFRPQGPVSGIAADGSDKQELKNE